WKAVEVDPGRHGIDYGSRGWSDGRNQYVSWINTEGGPSSGGSALIFCNGIRIDLKAHFSSLYFTQNLGAAKFRSVHPWIMAATCANNQYVFVLVYTYQKLQLFAAHEVKSAT